MKSQISKHIRIITTFTLLAPSLVFATNGYFSHGYGTKNKSLAGGGIALTNDSMSAATNPAGMVNAGNRFDIGIALFSPSQRSYAATADGFGLADGPCPSGQCPFTFGGNGNSQSIESDNDVFLIPHLAFNRMINNSSSFGISVYGNGGMNTEYIGGVTQHNDGTGTAITTPGTFGDGTAGINLDQLFIASTYASKFSENASWGIGIIFAYQKFEAQGLRNFAGFSQSPTSLSDNGVDTSNGFGLKLGLQTTIGSGVSFGASYQSEIDMSEFDKYSGLFAEKGDFDIPSTWTVGLGWKMTSNASLVFDIQKINYSDIPAISNPISYLAGASNSCATGTTSRCLGGSDGAGFGWRDMTIYKIGYELATSSSWVWRMGYSHGTQPIPDSEVVFNILAPAVIEDHLTLGFSFLTRHGSEVNLQFMHAFENSVTGSNTLNPSQNVTLNMVQNELEISWAKKF